jgi:CheY-like chemotaxis protein
VEDVPRLANDIAEGLRDQGMAVDVSYDGLDAVAKLNLVAYDVLVLDRNLPGLHGDIVCRMVTEADDYLAKPFHFPELVLRVRALARRKPAVHSLTLRANGVELDQLGRTATRDGRPLELSAKELAVLEALLRPRGAECRAPPRTGLGRERRPVHEDCAGDDRPAPPQARGSGPHRDDSGRRLPDRGRARLELATAPNHGRPGRWPG